MTRVQMRRGTTTEWTSANPVLTSGEEGYDTTVKDVKIGDGVTPWLSLPFDRALASSSANGHMSSADKLKVDGATSSNTANSIVARSSNGDSSHRRLYISDAPTAIDQATRKDYVDAPYSTVGLPSRINYVTNPIRSETSSFSAAGGGTGTGMLSFVAVTIGSKYGVLRYTQNTTATSSSGIVGQSTLAPVSVAIGDIYTVTVKLKVAKTTPTTIYMQPRYRVGGSSTAQTTPASYTVITPNEWVTLSYTMPASEYVADNIYVGFTASNNSGGVYIAPGEYMDVSYVLIEKGSESGEYFDGDAVISGDDASVYSNQYSGVYRASASYQYAKSNVAMREQNGNIIATDPTSLRAVTTKQYVDSAETTLRADLKKRVLVGFHPEGSAAVSSGFIGEDTFLPIYNREAEMLTKSDTASFYRAVNVDTARDYTRDVVPELRKNPNRHILYVLEMHRTNNQVINDFTNKVGWYWYTKNLFQAIIDGGHTDRVYLAPFHEANGPGGDYEWQMYDTTIVEGVRNTPASYKQVFKMVVDLAREMGLNSKIIQWFLNKNSDTLDSTAIQERIEDGYVGDDYVDIIGMSHYNRHSGSTNSTWTFPGNELRRFAARVSNFTDKPIWICEAGCYLSGTDVGLNKGQWYSDLIDLASSREIPNLEAVVMFLQTPLLPDAGRDYALENMSQKRQVGRAMNRARKGYDASSKMRVNRNLLHPTVAVPSTISGWVFAGTGITSTIVGGEAIPNWMDSSTTALRVTKPSHTVASPSDYAFHREMDAVFTEHERNRPYTLTFTARATVDKWQLSAGIRQHSSPNEFIGEESIQLSTQWAEYSITYSYGGNATSVWRIPYFRFGRNAEAGSIEITNIKLERGLYPTPSTEVAAVPKSRVMDATSQTWHCEYGELWSLTLTSNRTLGAPLGTAYDGQTISLRIKQDGVGSRVMTQSTNFRTSSVSSTLQTAPNTTNILTYQYDANAGKWGLISNIAWGV